MHKSLIAIAVAAIVTPAAFAQSPAVRGPMSFRPLTVSGTSGSEPACAPLKLPAGFSQSIITAENDNCPGDYIVLDARSGNDWNDMNTVNETGAQVGRFLYRTQETTPAALTAIDLQTGDFRVYVAEDFGIAPTWARFDGIEWTPWGTVLAAEENGSGGRLFECAVDGIDVECMDRPAVGRMSHEGIAVDAHGSVFVGDELNGGSIYKFVPYTRGDLSAGVLYGLNITDEGDDDIDGTGQGEWVALVPGLNGVLTDPAVSARAAADEAGLTDYLRPEDAEIIGPNLYFATTTDRRVLQIPINTDTPFVTEYFGVNIGNVGSESINSGYGLNSPDNLASDNAGNLYVVEDNSSESDVWVATPDRDGDGTADSVSLFLTLTTPGAEGTGIYFPRTMPKTMFINVQHANDGNDMTLMVTKD